MGLASHSFQLHPRCGQGTAVGHHGEVLQGAIDSEHNGIRRFLITLPWPTLRSRSMFFPVLGGEVQTVPDNKTKSRKAACLTLKHLGLDKEYGGFLEIRSDARPELGLGSSTSDVVASIRAVANAFGLNISPKDEAKLAVLSESASDSIMFDGHAVAFCQREGLILETLDAPLPSVSVLGFNTSLDGGGVSTIACPLPEYAEQDLGVFRSLLGALRAAVRTQSVPLMGKVATASAKINQRFLPKPYFNKLLEIANSNGSCGLQVAHSGSIAGFMFDPVKPGLPTVIQKTREELEQLGIVDTWLFNSAWETV